MGRRNEEEKAKHRAKQKRYCEKYPERIKESQRKYRNSEKGKEALARYYPRKKELDQIRRLKGNAKSIEECNKDLYHKWWTTAEERFLIDNYQIMSIKEISVALGRTYMAVERKRNKLGLKKGT